MFKMKSFAQIVKNTFKTHDFMQGDVGNCGLIASLASLSRRSEFLKEIAPKIIFENKLQFEFKMFSRGKPTKVTVDYNLPLDGNKSLVFARPIRNDKFPLASYFEKAFVKKACFNSYKNSEKTDPLFAFTSFSECMSIRRWWETEESKQNLMKFIKYEVDSKSSLVMTLSPRLYTEEEFSAHAYDVIDYNYYHKAVKLYDPNCNPENCASDEKLPHSLTANADSTKGELWVTIDQLKKRWVGICSLHSKDMYKSVFKLEEQINFSHLDGVTRKAVWKVCITEPSTFIINFFSYSHEVESVGLTVTNVDSGRREIYLKNDLPFNSGTGQYTKNGIEKSSYSHKFELQPNNYEFSFVFKMADEDLTEKIDDFLIKVGCTSECTFYCYK